MKTVDLWNFFSSKFLPHGKLTKKTPKYSLTTIERWPETLKAAGILAPMNIEPIKESLVR